MTFLLRFEYWLMLKYHCRIKKLLILWILFFTAFKERDLNFIDITLCIWIFDFSNFKLRKWRGIKGLPINKFGVKDIDRVIDFVLFWFFFAKNYLQISDKSLIKKVKLWRRINFYLNHRRFTFLFVFNNFLVHVRDVEIFNNA